MKSIIICGTRTFNSYQTLKNTLDSYLSTIDDDVRFISGGAQGADSLALAYAQNHRIPCIVIYADWNTYGKSAGPIRNKRMLEEAMHDNPVVIAFWDGISKGTKNMIDLAEKNNVELYIVNYATYTNLE